MQVPIKFSNCSANNPIFFELKDCMILNLSLDCGANHKIYGRSICLLYRAVLASLYHPEKPATQIFWFILQSNFKSINICKNSRFDWQIALFRLRITHYGKLIEGPGLLRCALKTLLIIE